MNPELRAVFACAALIPFFSSAAAFAQSSSHSWQGPYIGGHVGYGWGEVRLAIPQSSIQTTTITTTNCLDRLGQAYDLILPPAGSVFSSVATGNQSYPASIASLLGLQPLGGGLFQPTRRVAYDFRGQGPVAADECIAHNVYALGPDGNYYGGSQGAPLFPLPGFPPDFRPADINGTINTTTTTTTTSPNVNLGPFANAVVDPATLAALTALPGTTLEINTSGFVGGVQAGWNYMIAPKILIGIETDFAASTINGKTFVGTASASADVDWFGTLRGRIGSVSGPWLVYLTAGLAYGEGEVTYRAGGITASDSHILVGYTIGGGAEIALSKDVTLKAEYKYIDFGTDSYPGGTSFDVQGQFILNTAVVGLNFRF